VMDSKERTIENHQRRRGRAQTEMKKARRAAGQ
jgi:hypothetical protein